MSETEETDVLRRKARAGRAGHEARVMSPGRALRAALARAAEAQFELALTVNGIQSEQLLQEAMLRCVDDDMLFVVLDGPHGAVGAVALDARVVAAFIECQTIGKVSSNQGPARAPTATDAALVAPFIDMMLTEMTEGLGEPDGALAAGFCYGARIESKRHLQLIADAGEHHVMRAQLELAGGAKRGELVLILPVQEARPAPPGKQRKANSRQAPEARTGAEEAAGSAADGATDGADSAGKQMFGSGALLEAHAVLRAVIARQRMSLSRFSALAAGDVLALPKRSFDAVQLDAGVGSERLGPCKLGQFDGLRAVQLRFGGRRADGRESFEGLVPEAENRQGAPAQAERIAELDAGEDGLPDLSDLPGFEDFDPEADGDAAEAAQEPAPADGPQTDSGETLGKTGS